MTRAAPNDPPDQLAGWAERGSTSFRHNRLGVRWRRSEYNHG
jgi:hypothetical protein